MIRGGDTICILLRGSLDRLDGRLGTKLVRAYLSHTIKGIEV